MNDYHIPDLRYFFLDPNDEFSYCNLHRTDDGPPFHEAMKNSSPKTVDTLLAQGCDINALDCCGRTPLHLAVGNCFMQGVEVLLEGVVDFNAKDNHGDTVLHYCIRDGHEKLVKILIGKGCEVDVQNNDGLTPLHIAVREKVPIAIELLLAKGCNVNIKDHDGNTPLHFAYKARYWQTDIGEDLEENNVDIAAGRRYSDLICRQLLSQGADVNTKDNNNQTPLHLAVMRNRRLICKLFLSQNANVNVIDKNNQTPLHLAVKEVNKSICDLLLTKGADMNAKDNNNRTPLHLSVMNESDDVSICKLLLAKGAEVNVKDSKNRTPLHHASMLEQWSHCNILLDKGADVNLKDDDGNTAFHYAARKGFEFPVISFIDKGGIVDCRNATGQTILHAATQSANSEPSVIELLLIEGADVNAHDDNGNTPLHFAVDRCTNEHLWYDNKSCINILLDWGACLTSRNNEGVTPLDKASNTYANNFLVEHIIKMQCAQLPLDVQHQFDPVEFQSFKEHCFEKLDLMKLLFIDSYSLYDMFSLRNDPCYMSNDFLEVILKSDNYKYDIDTYFSLLRAMFREYKEATILRDMIKDSFIVSLPSDILEIVLSYLNHYDLESIIKADKHKADAYFKSVKSMRISLATNNDFNKPSENKYQYCSDHETSQVMVIHNCVKRSCLEEFKHCLDNNSLDLEAKDCCGKTPLSVAVDCGFEEAVILLIERGAELNARDDDNGNTPLHWAVIYNNINILDILVERGANMNKENFNGQVPLHLAIKQGQFSIVEALLKNGCNLHINDSYLGKYPLHFIFDLSYECLDLYLIFELLLANGAEVTTRDKCGKTPLHLAAAKINSEQMCAVLLTKGADVNAVDNNGETPLHVAIVNDNWDVCRMLLTRGANVNTKDNKGKSPLMFAVENCNYELVTLLLDNDVDIDATDNNGKTIFHFAAIHYSEIPSFRDLLDRCRDVNVQDKEGNTPLHCAVFPGQREVIYTSDINTNVVKELLEWGASINIKNNIGVSPFFQERCNRDLFLAHSIKLQSANMLKYKQKFESTELKDLEKTCFEEVNRMKAKNYGPHSLYKVFANYNDPTYTSSEELEEAVKASTLEAEFPNYYSLLDITFRKAKKRLTLLNAAQQYLLIPLPNESIRKILSYLNENDLRNVIKSGICIDSN